MPHTPNRCSYTVIAMEITQELLKELFYYDPVSGDIFFLERDRKWFKNDLSCFLWNNRWPGTINGSIQTNSYGYRRVKVSVLGKQRMAHRVIWVYMTGSHPPRQIDHIDRDATNNSWENLRDGSGSVNQRNKSIQHNNKSGYTGVSWSKQACKWVARAWCTVGGKPKYQHLGCFSDKMDAVRAAEAFRRANGYSPEHGGRENRRIWRH